MQVQGNGRGGQAETEWMEREGGDSSIIFFNKFKILITLKNVVNTFPSHFPYMQLLWLPKGCYVEHFSFHSILYRKVGDSQEVLCQDVVPVMKILENACTKERISLPMLQRTCLS